MSYSTVVDGLHARLSTVAGLKAVLKYEPTTIQDTPTLYTLFRSVRRGQAGQVTSMTYECLHRVLFRWQDNAQAELELMPYVNSVPAAIDLDPHLGQTGSTAPFAKITSATGGFVTVAGTVYRSIDFVSETLEKAPYRSGI